MAGRGRAPKWPWDEWLDGERHVLNSQQHFAGTTVRSLRQQLLNEVRRRNVEAETPLDLATRIAIDPRGDGIDYLEVKPRPPEPKKRVDWDAALKELPRTFVQGRDFDCDIEPMRVRIYQAAQRRELRVRTVTDGGEITVYSVREELVTEMAPAEEAERDG